MSKLSVEFLAPGMVLADDVRGSNGLVLLGEGAEITERHIEIFRTWGIAEVDIVGNPGANDRSPARELTPAEKAAVEAELDRMFQHNDPMDPVIEELRRICLQREIFRVASRS